LFKEEAFFLLKWVLYVTLGEPAIALLFLDFTFNVIFPPSFFNKLPNDKERLGEGHSYVAKDKGLIYAETVHVLWWY
jgi:hypothetical protein